MAGNVHMLILIPPKNAVSEVLKRLELLKLLR
jgi:REP element-mobilizing transposase RayT